MRAIKEVWEAYKNVVKPAKTFPVRVPVNESPSLSGGAYLPLRNAADTIVTFHKRHEVYCLGDKPHRLTIIIGQRGDESEIVEVHY